MWFSFNVSQSINRRRICIVRTNISSSYWKHIMVHGKMNWGLGNDHISRLWGERTATIKSLNWRLQKRRLDAFLLARGLVRGELLALAPHDICHRLPLTDDAPGLVAHLRAEQHGRGVGLMGLYRATWGYIGARDARGCPLTLSVRKACQLEVSSSCSRDDFEPAPPLRSSALPPLGYARIGGAALAGWARIGGAS